ncbi:MAG: cellulase family glycosylhydrolase [Saprospiraceae bacterium]|nr:cellulase family glycosylhydrolase [Saprospiraceae bacterium]
MKTPKKDAWNRRVFMKTSGLATAGLVLPSTPTSALEVKKNPIPAWKGFNLLDFFSPDPNNARPVTTEDFLRWIADWGFDFVRIPMAYPSYVKFDRSKPITTRRVRKIDRRAVEKVDQLVLLAQKYGLHVSLNLHRAPGFCVNAGFVEPYDLWKDEEAMDDFCYHWKFWAKRYRSMSRREISFDLLNEPCLRVDMNDQHSKRSAIPGPLYRKMVLSAAREIQRANPDHLIIADGNNVGRDVIPEIIDLDVAQSCRGYNPGIISHYKAPWVFKDTENLPDPVWPGQVGDQYLSRAMLEEMYAPWIALTQQGVGVHCGECGCYNKTPHQVFLAWFEDVIDVLTSHDIGYALWEFSGSFGLMNSDRKDIEYEDWYGQKLDRKLLDLLMKYH